MALSWREWAKISKDIWVTDAIQVGYVILFKDQPPTSKHEAFPSYSEGSERYLALDGEVAKMVLKGAIEPVAHPGSGFYSRVFAMPKPGKGKLCPINRLVDTQQVYRGPKVQVRDSKVRTPSGWTRRHYGFDGPPRRILPDSHSQGISEVAKVRMERNRLSVQGTLLRTVSGSPSVHQGIWCRGSVSPYSRNTSATISRRLVDPRGFPRIRLTEPLGDRQ